MSCTYWSGPCRCAAECALLGCRDARLSRAMQAEPVAWLFKTAKPGERREWASVDPNDSSWWPMDQGYTSVTRTPLVEAGTEEGLLPAEYVGKKWSGSPGFAESLKPGEDTR